MGDKSSDKRDAFSQRMVDILNGGALNLAMGIGYRTGLFDVMDKLNAPASAEAISKAAGVSSRYVEEWLGVMVSGKVVELHEKSDGSDSFFLPPEHGDLIARRAGNQNLGVYTQEIPLLTACAMEAVVDGFYTGNGVTYDHYPAFQNFMGQLADAKHRQILVDTFLPSVDSGRLVADLRKGIRVCDLGCAEGLPVLLMAEAFPNSRFVGIDISADAIDTAKKRAAENRCQNAEFQVIDATAAGDTWPNGFDYVTAFDAIHDQTHPRNALKNVIAILKKGGRFSMVDIAAQSRLADNKDHPMGPFLYTVSLMHCLPVGLVDNGAGLGMMWGRQKAVEMLEEAGFADVRVEEIPNDPFNLHFFCRKG